MNSLISKFISLILISGLIISSKSFASQPISIAFGLENYSFDFIFERFTEETGIEIIVKPFKNNQLKAELINRAKTEQLPDIVIVPSDFIGLSEIQFSKIPANLLSDVLNSQAKKSAMIGSEYFGIPIVYGNHLIMYYNKTLVQKPVVSWEQLASQNIKLSTDYRLIGWNYYEMYWFSAFLGIFDELAFKNEKLNFKTEGMIKALHWYKDLADSNLVDPSCDYSCTFESFKSGKLAYTINGTWALNSFSDALKDNLGVTLLPSYNNKPMLPYFSSHVVAFPNNGLSERNSKQLTEFAKFIQRNDIQDLIWLELRSLPTSQVALNRIMSSEQGNIIEVINQLKHAELLPNERNMAIVWEAMLKGVNRFQSGVFDAQKATEYMDYIARKSIEHSK